VCLPDLLYKSLLYLGGAPNWLCEPSHSPLALIPWCYVFAMLFEEEWRKRSFGALLGGSYLHLLLDLGKNYLGSGVIPWQFPFTMETVELGWYASEDSVVAMVPALVAIGLIEVGSRLLKSRRRASP
jgi:LexA-binding, inner membrane-associated putative hydrolase